MSRVRLLVVTADLPDVKYIKAMADVYDDKIVILDRRSNVLHEVEGPIIKQGMVYAAGGDGNAVIVRNMAGACGCGGMRTIKKDGAAT